MRRLRIVIFFTPLTVLTGITHGQEKPARDAQGVYSELAKAPPKDAVRHNPLERDPEAILAGAKLFAQHCAECHGETAEGGKGRKAGPSLRAPQVQQAPAGTLFWLLTNGVVRRGMPVWSRLPEPQRWQLVTYLKSLGPISATKSAESPSP
jgi:mono/diheme cytochrome c family protein